MPVRNPRKWTFSYDSGCGKNKPDNGPFSHFFLGKVRAKFFGRPCPQLSKSLNSVPKRDITGQKLDAAPTPRLTHETRNGKHTSPPRPLRSRAAAEGSTASKSDRKSKRPKSNHVL